MTDIFLIILGLVIFSTLVQTHVKIPAPLTLLGSVLIVKFFGGEFFHINNNQFDTLVLIILPLLIMVDTLKLDPDEIKHNSGTLFLIACVTVVLSVGLGVLVNRFILPEYAFSFAAIMALFCMLTATDPVTVSAVFSNLKVPHRLRFLTEGESLFNDATALILFSIALALLINPQTVTPGFVAFQSIKVAAGAILIGLVLGSVGCLTLRATNDVLLEGAVIIFLGYLSFWFAEYNQMSGIIALIICMLIISKRIKEQFRIERQKLHGQAYENSSARRSLASSLNLFTCGLTNTQNMLMVYKMFSFVAVVATGVLFVSMAHMVSFAELKRHWQVILIVFVATSVIRGFVMLVFAILSNRLASLTSVCWRWWAVLTFAGSKGALSLVMVNFIPDNFIHKKLFETIVVGNVLLSTFLYGVVLIGIFYIFKRDFENDRKEEPPTDDTSLGHHV